MTETIRDITGYATSTDYNLLWDVAQQQSVVCITDMAFSDGYTLRDVCRTLGGNGRVELSCRGTCYVYANDKLGFAASCNLRHVEWIVPNAQIRERAGMKGGTE